MTHSGSACTVIIIASLTRFILCSHSHQAHAEASKAVDEAKKKGKEEVKAVIAHWTKQCEARCWGHINRLLSALTLPASLCQRSKRRRLFVRTRAARRGSWSRRRRRRPTRRSRRGARGQCSSVRLLTHMRVAGGAGSGVRCGEEGARGGREAGAVCVLYVMPCFHYSRLRRLRRRVRLRSRTRRSCVTRRVRE